MSVDGIESLVRKFAKAAVVVPSVGVPNGLAKAGLLVERAAKIKAPVGETGNLRSSIAMQPPTLVSVDVTAQAEYSVYVEVGTGPHDIVPNKAGALFWPGAAHPVAIVHHPGTAAQPFMRPALDENKPQIEVILGASVMTSIQGALV